MWGAKGEEKPGGADDWCYQFGNKVRFPHLPAGFCAFVGLRLPVGVKARILARYKPRLNTTSLVWQLKQADEYTRDALENLKSTRHITLYYEDLILNRTKLFDVLDFLKVPRRKLVSRHVKIHTKPLSEQIENWDEVYSTLNGTQYESFLNAADYIT
nr:unnamed protein product [Digitaria exilis]